MENIPVVKALRCATCTYHKHGDYFTYVTDQGVEKDTL